MCAICDNSLDATDHLSYGNGWRFCNRMAVSLIVALARGLSDCFAIHMDSSHSNIDTPKFAVFFVCVVLCVTSIQ